MKIIIIILILGKCAKFKQYNNINLNNFHEHDNNIYEKYSNTIENNDENNNNLELV